MRWQSPFVCSGHFRNGRRLKWARTSKSKSASANPATSEVGFGNCANSFDHFHGLALFFLFNCWDRLGWLFQTEFELLPGYREFEYLWFLQLLASLNFATTISFPQILPPARRGVARKSRFRSAKY